MAFSESLKLEVKKRSAFRCCRCNAIGVEIHHIVPQKDGGPDTIENAAPLCPRCHEDFGDNPSKRKAITEMRDWWYETVERMYSPPKLGIGDLLQSIDSMVLASKENANQIEDLKSALRSYAEKIIDNISPQSAQATATGIINIIPLDTGYWVHPDQLADEGYCRCERNLCVDHDEKVYCYYPKWLPDWVIRKRLYWKCYDEIVNCPRCGVAHKRGHIGKLGVCRNPYKNQESQTD